MSGGLCTVNASLLLYMHELAASCWPPLSYLIPMPNPAHRSTGSRWLQAARWSRHKAHADSSESGDEELAAGGTAAAVHLLERPPAERGGLPWTLMVRGVGARRPGGLEEKVLLHRGSPEEVQQLSAKLSARLPRPALCMCAVHVQVALAAVSVLICYADRSNISTAIISMSEVHTSCFSLLRAA